MPENLTIRFCGSHLEWLLLDDASGIIRLRGNGGFEKFEGLIQGVSWMGETRVLIGGEDVLLTRVRIPSRQQRQIVQAIPYAVEEELARNVDDCHFAMGKRGGDDELEIAIIDRALMQSILTRLNAAGLRPAFMSPDLLMIPNAEGTHILIDGDRAHLLTPGNLGFTTTIGQLPLTVSLLSESERESLQVHLHPDMQESSSLCLSQIHVSEAGNLQEHELECYPFEFMCRNFDKNKINLLQGEFKVQQVRAKSRTSWGAVAILSSVVFTLHILFTMAKGLYFEEQASNYESEAATLYKEVFPGDRNVRDIKRRWRSHLGGSSTESALFLPLFAEVVVKINGSDLVLQNVNYNESRGDLILQFTAPRSERLVSFVENLTKDGLQAEIGTISQDESSVRGSVKVKSLGAR